MHTTAPAPRPPMSGAGERREKRAERKRAQRGGRRREVEINERREGLSLIHISEPTRPRLI
eukprot:636231-Rhodomonas_salina.1